MGWKSIELKISIVFEVNKAFNEIKKASKRISTGHILSFLQVGSVKCFSLRSLTKGKMEDVANAMPNELKIPK